MKKRDSEAAAPIGTARLFRRGMEALNSGFPSRGVGYFGAAAEAEGLDRSTPEFLRALSYYGLSLALAEGPSSEAIEACERAAARGGADPDLCANLGWVYLLAGRRAAALSALHCAREMNPRNRRLGALLRGEPGARPGVSPRPPRRPLPHRSIRKLPPASLPAGM
jgi:hypothetical protein